MTDRAPAVRRQERVRRPVAGTVVLLGVVSMLTDISSEAVTAVLPIYLTAVVGLTPLAYGFVDGLYQGVSALVRILGGWLSDRGDHPKWVAFSGYALSAVTRLALIPAQGVGSVTAVLTVDRLGKGLRTAPRDALIAASSPLASLGQAFGVHRALDTTGAMIGPLLAFGILFVVPGDYRSVFVVSFAAAVVGLAVLLFFVPDLRPARAAAEPDQPMPRPSLRILANRRFGALVAAAGLLGVLTVGDGFIYLTLYENDGLPAHYFPLLYVGTNFAYLALAVPLGRLSDRVGRRHVFVAGHVALLAAYLCAAGLLAGPAATVSCLLLLGAYYAATDGVLAAMTGHLVSPVIRASGIATTQTVVAAARFVSSLAFGLLWTLVGQDAALLVVAAALAMALPVGWLLLRRAEVGPDTVLA
jgi:MFS family permease